MDFQNSDSQKIQLTFAINFISPKYSEEERVMHSSGNNIKFIPYSDAGNGDKNRDLSLDEYLNKIKPHLGNITIDFQNSDVWKIQLPVAVNFISPNDSKKKRVTH